MSRKSPHLAVTQPAKSSQVREFQTNDGGRTTKATLLNTTQLIGEGPASKTPKITWIFWGIVITAACFSMMQCQVSKNLRGSKEEASVASDTKPSEGGKEAVVVSSEEGSLKQSKKKKSSFKQKTDEGSKDLALIAGQFAVDSSELTQPTQNLLKNWANKMKKDQKLKIKVSGHADERGSEAYNEALSKDRAQAAKKYLVELGVAPARIKIKAYGKRKPLSLGRQEADLAKNRRVEIKKMKEKASSGAAESGATLARAKSSKAK